MSQIHILLPNMVQRKTMGKRLEEARLAQGMTLKEVQERISREFGFEIGESTIRSIERDQIPNPGVKTVEMCARGVDLEPIDVITMLLEEPPVEQVQAFSKSRFAQLWHLYSQLDSARKALYDEIIEMVFEKMKKG